MFVHNPKFKALLVFLLIIAATLLGGCGRQTAETGQAPAPSEQPKRQLQPLPEKTVEIAGVRVTTGGGSVRGGVIDLARFAVPGGTFYYTQATLTSPDGRWITFHATQDNRTPGLWVMSLDGSDGRLLARVGERGHEAGTLFLELLGWTEDNRVVFIRQGTQPDGPHKGERGISLRAAHPAGGEPQEVCWLPVPRGIVHQVKFLPEKGGVFVHISGALWRMDIANGLLTLIKDKLPTYDGLFIPRLSPDGGYYVYELHEPGKKGIYRLSTQTGEETPLAPNGATWNFFPRISPDGNHIAYYAAPLKPGRSGPGADDYDLIPMEDGPAPVAAGVDIVSAGGRKVAHLQVPGAKIGDIRWSADGSRLALVAGIIKGDNNSPGADQPAIEWQSIWVADLSGNLKKLTDLLPETAGRIHRYAGIDGYVTILSLSPDGRQAYYLHMKEKSSLWLAREGKAPVELKPGARGWEYSDSTPIFGEDLFLCQRGSDGEQEIFRIHGPRVVQVTADGGMKSNLRVEGSRILYLREDKQANRNQLAVLSIGAAGHAPVYGHY
ncbi:MAG: hypothetical protein AB1426_02295 [Bacillota bacterium]